MIPLFGVNAQNSQMPYYTAAAMALSHQPMTNPMPILALAPSPQNPSPAMGSASGPPEVSASNVFRTLKIAFDALILGGFTSFIFRVNSKVSMLGNMATSILEGLAAHRIIEGKQGWTQPILKFYKKHLATDEARKDPKAPLGTRDKRRYLYFVGSLVTFIGAMLTASINNIGKRFTKLKTPTKLIKPAKNATTLTKQLYKLGMYIEKQPIKCWLEKRPGMMFVIGGVGALIGGGIEALFAQGIADKANTFRKTHFAASHSK